MTKSLAPGPEKSNKVEDEPGVQAAFKPGTSDKSTAAHAAVEVPDELYEVLIRNHNGHQTIWRVEATDAATATAAIQAKVDASGELGLQVIDAAPSGSGLGSITPTD